MSTKKSSFVVTLAFVCVCSAAIVIIGCVVSRFLWWFACPYGFPYLPPMAVSGLILIFYVLKGKPRREVVIEWSDVRNALDLCAGYFIWLGLGWGIWWLGQTGWFK